MFGILANLQLCKAEDIWAQSNNKRIGCLLESSFIKSSEHNGCNYFIVQRPFPYVQPLRKINDTFRASPPLLQQEFYRQELQNIANALGKKSFEQSYLICAKLA